MFINSCNCQNRNFQQQKRDHIYNLHGHVFVVENYDLHELMNTILVDADGDEGTQGSEVELCSQGRL